MSTARIYDASTGNISLDAEIQRLKYQANMCVERESQKLMSIGLRDGMSVLEVASGPGFVTEWLSRLVPNGSITCLEIDPILVKYAADTFKNKLPCPCDFVEGSVMKMDFPDNSFDFVFVRLLFENLEDPVGAATEIKRVLRPGGKMVITDGDFALNVITDPYVPEGQAIREKMRQLKGSQGGNAMIGRRLWKIVKAAGFRDIGIDAMVAHSGDKDLQYFYPLFNPDRVTPFVKQGILTAEEHDNLRIAVENYMNSEEPYFMRILLTVVGEKQ
jgi:ubiquinone/menaquinone biosynthesis C-methylase UbiE